MATINKLLHLIRYHSQYGIRFTTPWYRVSQFQLPGCLVKVDQQGQPPHWAPICCEYCQRKSKQIKTAGQPLKLLEDQASQHKYNYTTTIQQCLFCWHVISNKLLMTLALFITCVNQAIITLHLRGFDRTSSNHVHFTYYQHFNCRIQRQYTRMQNG